eukprot:3069610-Heterocapsa_arctica.AAC.1
MGSVGWCDAPLKSHCWARRTSSGSGGGMSGTGSWREGTSLALSLSARWAALVNALRSSSGMGSLLAGPGGGGCLLPSLRLPPPSAARLGLPMHLG